jgi:hypothetical protein
MPSGVKNCVRGLQPGRLKVFSTQPNDLSGPATVSSGLLAAAESIPIHSRCFLTTHDPHHARAALASIAFLKNKLSAMGASATAVPNKVQSAPSFIPTELQQGILAALDGRALSPKDLIREVKAKNTLYKPGGIKDASAPCQ